MNLSKRLDIIKFKKNNYKYDTLAIKNNLIYINYRYKVRDLINSD